jgi:hypothetical protein
VLRDAIAISHRNVAPHREVRTVSTTVRVDWILQKLHLCALLLTNNRRRFPMRTGT